MKICRLTYSTLRNNDQFLENQSQRDKTLIKNKAMIALLQQETIIADGLPRKLVDENANLVAQIKTLTDQHDFDRDTVLSELQTTIKNMGNNFATEMPLTGDHIDNFVAERTHLSAEKTV